ncbi:MAG: phosphate ABC transporter substrate-binding protein PstS [Anaerolineales bacterium]
MKKKMLSSVALIAAAGLFLSACGSAAPATVKVTRAVNQTVIVTPTSGPATETPLAPGSVQINGAGATFPLPVYSAWTYAYKYVDPAVVINYQGIGSGGGKKAIIDGTVDFAGSDSLLKDEEYTAGKDLQMYPMLAGAVVPIYSIQWAKDFASGAKIPVVVLDRQTLVDIYNAKVTKWNDPKIVATNPDLKDYLPDSTITAVHRSDGSGTTEIFTKSLASFSPDWTAGGASSVEWPVDKAGNGIGGKGNQGVAAAVINTPNSIGYVELSYALSNNMAYASLVNKAGKTVVANAASLNSAMSDFAGAFSDKLTATIVDAPGAGSWPIAGYTYLILHTQNMPDCVKAQKLLEFIRWALTDPSAGTQASNLGYSVLPTAVRDTVLAKLGAVACKGTVVLH